MTEDSLVSHRHGQADEGWNKRGRSAVGAGSEHYHQASVVGGVARTGSWWDTDDAKAGEFSVCEN